MNVDPSADVTQLLAQIEQGDLRAGDQLLPLVYAELRKLAAARLEKEKPGQTLQPTALVHEAYLRLVDTQQTEKWNSRGHFFGAAAEAMRRILVDNARQKQARKRGGDRRRIVEELDELPAASDQVQLLELDQALRQLEIEQPSIARLVILRYFGGLSLKDAAVALDISERTAHRHWQYAKAWLKTALEE